MSSRDWIQSVSCRDAAGRAREVKIQLGAGDDEIVLVSPPGEITRLSGGESMLLRAALADAETERQRRGSS